MLTFDSNNPKIVESLVNELNTVECYSWCNKSQCINITNLSFDAQNYLYYNTPISYLSNITEMIPKKNCVHFILLDFSESEIIKVNYKILEIIIENIKKLLGFVIIITNNYEKTTKLLKQSYVTYVFETKNYTSNIISRFVAQLLTINLKTSKLLHPNDLSELWRTKKLPENFRKLEAIMNVNLNDFSINECVSKMIKTNCSLCS